jgi:tRNA(Ile)-lysidine synthase TilS/MesJ
MVQLSKKLLSNIGRTNAKYSLMNEGDRVLLGLSGGKDSLTLAHALNHRRKVVPFDFDFLAVTIDYGDGTDFSSLIAHCKAHDIPHIVHQTNIYEVAKDTIRENSSYCSYFSRMRRGALYQVALERGYGKLALGHHLDDAVESFFMNFLYNGALRAMPPIYRADNGLLVIRPLIHVRERQLIDAALNNEMPTIGDEACPGFNFEAKMPHARAETKRLLHEMEQNNKQLFVSLKAAFEHIHESSFFDVEKLRV